MEYGRVYIWSVIEVCEQGCLNCIISKQRFSSTNLVKLQERFKIWSPGKAIESLELVLISRDDRVSAYYSAIK